MANSFSYWERTAFVGDADVIVIGSGLVGLSAALHLKTQQPNLNVLVLERGFLPTGASTKNAGFACFGMVSEQLAALEESSEEEIMRMVDYKWRGLRQLRQNLGDNNIDFYQDGGYELFGIDETKQAEHCIDRIDYLNKLLKDITGPAPVYSVADDRIASFGFKGIQRMIFNPYEGRLHTGKMMRVLLQQVYARNVLVLNECSVNSINQADGHLGLITNQGNFKAKQVILATNAFANQLFPELRVIPGRGQVLVTNPISGLKLKGTYHFDEGYYYFRNIDNRVLFGGGRNLDFKAEETWEMGQTNLVQQQLITYLTERILPNQSFEVDYSWSGIMGFGDKITPIIKQVEPGVFCAVRCNGMGVAMGSLVGVEVADLALNANG